MSDSSRSCGNWHPQNYGGSHGGGGAHADVDGVRQVAQHDGGRAVASLVGREKVIEMTRRVGIRGIRRTCSMALGDYGITPLEHTGGVATFINGGKRVRPYGVLEITNSKGELVYSRERDEPEPPQIVAPRVAQHMNQLMHRVVTDGTGKSAGARVHARRRQDRHQHRPARRLVRRRHRQVRDERLVRQRRQPADGERHDRRRRRGRASTSS